MNNHRQNPHAARDGAFTLVELLVVIGVIGLLVSILLPSLARAKLLANNSQSQSWLRNISDGAGMYKNDTGYYPGQQYETALSSVTGSQMLSAALLNLKIADLNSNTLTPDPKYLGAKTEDLLDEEGNAFNDKYNTLGDHFGYDPMPVLYYPARLGTKGLGQYKSADNDAYTSGVEWKVDGQVKTFADYIENTQFRTKDVNGNDVKVPYRPGEFLLIGAGLDRKFGTNDDLRNW